MDLELRRKENSQWICQGKGDLPSALILHTQGRTDICPVESLWQGLKSGALADYSKATPERDCSDREADVLWSKTRFNRDWRLGHTATEIPSDYANMEKQ